MAHGDVCGSILFGEWCQTCEPVIEDDELLEHTTEEVEEET